VRYSTFPFSYTFHRLMISTPPIPCAAICSSCQVTSASVSALPGHLAVRLELQAVFATGAERRGCFGGDQQPASLILVLVDEIVDADDIQGLGESVLYRGSHLIHAGCHRPRRIFTPDNVRQPQGHRATLRCGLFFDFIANAPQNDARVVAVATDHAHQVPLAPLFKEPPVAIPHPALGYDPFIERLVHDDRAHPVAEIEQFRRRRVVAGADRVAAHRLEDLKLSLDRTAMHGRSQAAQVVVVAHALYLQAPAIEQEAPVGRELDGADAEWRFVTIGQATADADLGNHPVQVRILDRPAPGGLNLERLAELMAAIGGDLSRRLMLCNFLPAGIDDRRDQRRIDSIGTITRALKQTDMNSAHASYHTCDISAWQYLPRRKSLLCT